MPTTANPFLTCLILIWLNAWSLSTTMTGATPNCMAVCNSAIRIEKPPSPHRETTCLFGKISLAARAEGTPNPMVPRGLDMSTELG